MFLWSIFFYNPVDGTRYYVDEDITVEENALVSALTSALQNITTTPTL